MSKNLDLNIELNQKILRARAVKLAMEENVETNLHEVEILEFMLADEKYGLETEFILEVYPLKGLTSLPCTPSFVSGLINVRGKLFSVLDLATFFELNRNKINGLHKVIILKSADMEFGVLADEIIGVKNISLSELETYLPTLTGIRSEYLKGFTKESLIILDGGKILRDKNLIVEEEII